jgi:hypothetical protein
MKLIGGQKQIALANEIKDVFLSGKELSKYHSHRGLIPALELRKADLVKNIEKLNSPSVPEKLITRIQSKIEMINNDISEMVSMISKIESQENASWFIDNDKITGKAAVCFFHVD